MWFFALFFHIDFQSVFCTSADLNLTSRLEACQMLSGHMGWVATVLDSTTLGLSLSSETPSFLS